MMKTFLKLAALLLALSNLGQAQTANWVGWCFKGGQPVITQGLGSTNPVMATYPNCTVTVYLQGTTTLATIFADKTNTPLSNPFTANADASFMFYAVQSTHVDVVISGGTPSLPLPFTFSDQIVGGAGTGGSVISLQTNGVNNVSQALLNLVAGTNITLTNTSGATTVSATGGSVGPIAKASVSGSGDVGITGAIASLAGGNGIVWADYSTNQTWVACPTWGAGNIHAILYPVAYTVSVNCTIPPNVTLEFKQGAKLAPATGTTTTIQGNIRALVTQIFSNIASGQGALSFVGNRTITIYSPVWFGIDCTGVVDVSPIWNQIVAFTGEDTTFVVPNNCFQKVASTITVPSRSGFKLKSEDRVQNGGGNQHPIFTWTGSSGGMWDFQANQAATVEGFQFFNSTNVDYYLRFNGNPVTRIGTEEMVRYNTFTSNTNNPNFVAITISPFSGNNHEKNLITDNDFVCSQSAALLETNSGSITSGSNVLTCGAGNCTFVADANVGDRVRISYAGQSPTLSSVGILDTTVSSITDNNHIVMAANAAATQTNARVHFRQAYGIGIYIGDVNAKHNTLERNSFTQCSSGLNVKNGSFSAAHFGGTFNDELVHIDNISEASELAYLESESDLRYVYLGSLDSEITLSHLRTMNGSNGLGLSGGPLSNGYIYINAGAHVTLTGSIIQNTSVANAVVIGAAAPQNSTLVSIGNQWTPGTGSGATMANMGFNQWRTVAESGSAQAGFLISCGDFGILDAPGACYQFGEGANGGTVIGTEGHLVVNSAHPNNVPSFNTFTAEPNVTSTGFANEARGFKTNFNGFNNSTSMIWLGFDAQFLSGVRGGNFGGFRAGLPTVSATTMPFARGLWVQGPTANTAITTASGVYIEDLATHTGIANRYSFFGVGATDTAHFGGPLEAGGPFTFNVSKNQHFQTFAAQSDSDGICTMASGACTAIVFATPYNTKPSCVCSWTGSGTFTTGAALKCNQTTTQVAPSSTSGTDTAEISYHCGGTPN